MPAAIATAVAFVAAATATACPFCGPVGRSLAERRDAAARLVVADAVRKAGRADEGLLLQDFAAIVTLRGGELPPGSVVEARVEASVPGTALLFGMDEGPVTRWEAIAADESLIDHVARAPAVEEPVDRRLRWFAARLEHPHEAIAADAFTEFGNAPFDAVAAVATDFDAARLRAWLADEASGRRRGFYGLALGLTVAAAPADDRAASIAALHAAVEAAGDDLRAGYDGILGGVLVAEGLSGLEYLERRGLFAADTRPGDARHALAALRFAWESLAESIPRERVAVATADLLGNPAVAAEAATDLARYRRWSDVDRVAALWTSVGRDDPLIRRAVAGYLEACPLPAAAAHRDRLAAADPVAWQAAREAAAGPAR